MSVEETQRALATEGQPVVTATAAEEDEQDAGASLEDGEEDEGDEGAYDGDGDEDDEDDDGEKLKGKKARKASVNTQSLATILGLPEAASEPARRTRALTLVSLERCVLSITGAATAAEAEGRLQALADDAGQAAQLRTELKALKSKANYAERMALLRKLANANLPGYTRGDLFVDVVGADGKRTVKPSALYANAKLATLRGLVDSKLESRAPGQAPKAATAAFTPDTKAAQAGGVSDIAKRAAQNANCDPERAAAAERALFGGNQ